MPKGDGVPLASEARLTTGPAPKFRYENLGEGEGGERSVGVGGLGSEALAAFRLQLRPRYPQDKEYRQPRDSDCSASGRSHPPQNREGYERRAAHPVADGIDGKVNCGVHNPFLFGVPGSHGFF